MRVRSVCVRSALTGCFSLLCACGGGVPLLHPAHPLPADTVSAGAGVSGHFASDRSQERVDRGRLAAAGSLNDPAQARDYAAGIFTSALIAPELSPWVAARIGLGHASEAGLTYTGRAVRIDGRHVFPLSETWGLSVGLGASALLPPRTASRDPVVAASAGPDTELRARGWGGDVPILLGYEAFGGFFELWTGTRAGYDSVNGELDLGSDSSLRADASGSRWWLGGVAGFGFGLPPVWFRFELAATAHWLDGEISAQSVSGTGGEPPTFAAFEATGWSLAPSAALVGKF